MRLAPWQRINRLWGMYALSRKESLVRTFDAFYGRGKCPFTPATYLYADLRTSRSYSQLVASQKEWLIKTSAHRGQGVRLVKSDVLLAAEISRSGGGISGGNSDLPDAAADQLGRWLRSRAATGAMLQVAITNPLLIGGRKSSLRLYSLITSAEPMRVYLHDEGFALFASNRYSSESAASDPLSFLTNAAQNRAGHSTDADSTDKGVVTTDGDNDHQIARSIGLRLPKQRWTLTSFLRFVEARQSKLGWRRQQQQQQQHNHQKPPKGSSPAQLRRALERLVLQTYVAAQSQLRDAATESLGKLGLSGAHQYAATFELAAFDVLFDDELKPWLLEVNTSPSMKAETAWQGSSADASDEAKADRQVKQRVVRDMLALIDAIPEAAPPPEEELVSLLRDNERRNSTTGRHSGCLRPWKLGGCQHCPTWSDVAAIWRASCERRRAGGFVPLMPSRDPEWTALTRQGRRQKRTMEDALHEQTAAGQRPSPAETLAAWLEADPGPQDCPAAGCIRRKWDAMLCKAQP